MATQTRHEPFGRPIVYDDTFIENEARLLEEWIKEPDNYFVNKFALQRGYDYHLPILWAKSNKYFSAIYSRAKQMQEVKLMEAGLNGKHKEQMSKFVLVNHHNYKEKVEQSIQQDTTFTVKTVNYNAAKPNAIEDQSSSPDVEVVPTFS